MALELDLVNYPEPSIDYAKKIIRNAIISAELAKDTTGRYDTNRYPWVAGALEKAGDIYKSLGDFLNAIDFYNKASAVGSRSATKKKKQLEDIIQQEQKKRIETIKNIFYSEQDRNELKK